MALSGILGSAFFKSGAPLRLARAEDSGWFFVVLAEGLVRSPPTGLRDGTDDLDSAGYGQFLCWLLCVACPLLSVLFRLDELMCGAAPLWMP